MKKPVDPEIAEAQAKAKAAIKDISDVEMKIERGGVPHTGRKHAASTLRAHEVFGAPLPTGPTK